MIRTLIVDDEPLARDALRVHVEREPELELAGECRTGREAVQAIRELSPDLLFLDVRMPDLSGFEVLAQLDKDPMPYVVFVTAHDEYALRAFQVHALAYLLKPFDDVRFAETMRHVRRCFSGQQPDAREHLAALLEELRGERPPVRFVAKTGLRSRIVAAADVDWIEADGNYVRLHCGADSHLVCRSMKELAETLDGRQFVRIHRSTIVNIERIRELHTDDYRDYTVILRDGQRLRLSRSYRQALEAALGDRI